MEHLAQAGIEPPVCSWEDSYDNAATESVKRLYKAEVIHRRAPWKTRAAVERATPEGASEFNYHRLPEPIGYILRAEAEVIYYRQLAEKATLEV